MQDLNAGSNSWTNHVQGFARIIMGDFTTKRATLDFEASRNKYGWKRLKKLPTFKDFMTFICSHHYYYNIYVGFGKFRLGLFPAI